MGVVGQEVGSSRRDFRSATCRIYAIYINYISVMSSGGELKL